MSNPKKIMITGASGLVGSRLTEMLLQKGYEVVHLSRGKKEGPVKSFAWKIEQGYIESGALAGVDTVVHLAGAGVADKPWTEKRKREILLSRTLSTRLLYEELKKGKHQVKAFVSASGIGYYGVEDAIMPYTEDEGPGSDFLADVTRQWEAEADRITEIMRVCKIRTGIVLSDKGGALPKLAQPVRLFVGSPLGSGKQMMNWIHIDDLCSLYIKAIEDSTMTGPYNAVAPNPVTNRVLTKAIGHVLHKPVFMPAVPSVIMKLLLGDMAYIVLKGGTVSSSRTERSGFRFKFTDLDQALADLLK